MAKKTKKTNNAQAVVSHSLLVRKQIKALDDMEYTSVTSHHICGRTVHKGARILTRYKKSVADYAAA